MKRCVVLGFGARSANAFEDLLLLQASRTNGFDFKEWKQQAPDDLTDFIQGYDSILYQRKRYYAEAMIDVLITKAGYADLKRVADGKRAKAKSILRRSMTDGDFLTTDFAARGKSRSLPPLLLEQGGQ